MNLTIKNILISLAFKQIDAAKSAVQPKIPTVYPKVIAPI